MTSPYLNTKLYTTVSLNPHQMNNKLYLNLKKNLIKKVSEKCYGKYGYIMYVYQILNYKQGFLRPENFNTAAVFNVEFSCKICRPIIKTQIICQIEVVNKSFLRLKNGPILLIVRSDRINNDIFSYDISNNLQYKKGKTYQTLNHNDFVKATILSTLLNDGDNRIVSVGFLDDIATKKEIENYHKDLYIKEDE